MILYDLKCGAGHVFEAWFRNSQTFDEQREAQAVACPVCGNDDVSKAPMAPNISTRSKTIAINRDGEAPAPAARSSMHAMARGDGEKQAELYSKALREALEQVRAHVEANFDYVGRSFPEEARRIHYGEAEPRPIYGDASPQESAALREEGVEVVEIPFLPKHNA